MPQDFRGCILRDDGPRHSLYRFRRDNKQALLAGQKADIDDTAKLTHSTIRSTEIRVQAIAASYKNH
jgi:hypothetical protein